MVPAQLYKKIVTSREQVSSLGRISPHKQTLPKVFVCLLGWVFFLKLTYKQAVCPLLSQLALRALQR